ncbi:hypothetical protein [Agrococcus sp. Marseille-Q4369]|uniref:phosphotransferase enzyme family protein n=1 Tax=Agrococcus sp. Marseille-Q4369 TaxID=2810513 RepID=UPI001B8A97F0|nr:hypothetical protein [Agrococcus sp. Marseille-Q4369]QUW19012.1 hypothetical protein JSQ78_01145 [Agrococcus sp. Marseille-Q4369]
MAQRDEVQAAFGEVLTIEPGESLSPWSEVWPARVHGGDGDVAAVVKRTWSAPVPLEAWQRALVAHGIRTVAPLVPPVAVGSGDQAEPFDAATTGGGAGDEIADDENWVAYPRLRGREWDGGADDPTAAGRLLGRMHAASAGLAIDGFPPFEWGSADRRSIDEDIDAIRDSAAQHWPHSDASRWIAQLDGFADRLERMRAADVPAMPVSLDHRAVNLLFDDQGALALDLENAAFAPRILDLAVAALLFPLEHVGSGGSALGSDEWAAFRGGYLSEAHLTQEERDIWPNALTYMKLEWGTWHLTEGVESEPEGNLGYLDDLLTLDEHARFPLH